MSGGLGNWQGPGSDQCVCAVKRPLEGAAASHLPPLIRGCVSRVQDAVGEWVTHSYSGYTRGPHHGARGDVSSREGKRRGYSEPGARPREPPHSHVGAHLLSGTSTWCASDTIIIYTRSRTASALIDKSSALQKAMGHRQTTGGFGRRCFIGMLAALITFSPNLLAEESSEYGLAPTLGAALSVGVLRELLPGLQRGQEDAQCHLPPGSPRAGQHTLSHPAGLGLEEKRLRCTYQHRVLPLNLQLRARAKQRVGAPHGRQQLCGAWVLLRQSSTLRSAGASAGAGVVPGSAWRFMRCLHLC